MGKRWCEARSPAATLCCHVATMKNLNRGMQTLEDREDVGSVYEEQESDTTEGVE